MNVFVAKFVAFLVLTYRFCESGYISLTIKTSWVWTQPSSCSFGVCLNCINDSIELNSSIKMATESPIRMVEARGKWPSHKESTAYVSSSASMAVDEMLLGKGHNYHGGRTIVPNRSGSAPPSIEGSLAAIGDLVQSQGLKCHLSHIAGGDKKWRSISLDDSSNSSLYLSRGTLPTHKEESEDDRSPRQASVDWTGRIPAMLSLQESSPSIVRQRSLVELMQEEFSGIPAASYDQPHTFGRGAAGGVVSHNVNYSSLDDQSGSVSNAVGSTINVEDVMAPSDADHSVPFASRSSSHDSRGHTGLPLRKEDTSSMNVHLEDETSVGDSNINSIQSGVKALKLSVPSNMGNYRSQEERQHISSDNFVQEQTGQQQYSLQFQGPTPQIVSQGIGNAYGINQIPHVGKFSPAEVQPVLQSSGFTPPVYATPAAYMPSANPYYSGVQSPGFIYSPQYGVGGYAYNTSMFPSYLAGYPTHNTLPLPFDGAATQNYNIRTSGGPSGGSNSNPIDMQHLNKYYGKFGVVQPSFADPGTQLHQPFVDLYNVPGQVDPIALGDGVIGTQGTGGPTNVNQRRGRIPTPNYFGSSANMGAFMNIPSSSLGSSVIPTSVFSGNSFLGGRNEPSFSPNAGRTGRSYTGWPSHRAFESLNHPKTYSFLEELKSGKGRRFELSDIAGHVVELSVDQHGSRFIQQKLENCSVEEKASVFAEVVPHASKLMTDVFGNYVIQKFFEYGTPEQRKELANQLAGQILSLSMQMYGCRVIQKALDVIELDQKAQLVRELDGQVMRCVRDQNGNHVIQKCIESIPIEKIDFIISAFRGQVPTLAMHPYGCRVIQRILERCTDELQSQFIVDEILESVCTLAQDQYGNYVTQHVLERGKPEERCQIIKKLAGQIVQLSQHKFASNVVEKCLEYGDTATRELLIDEIVGLNDGNDNLLMMMKDQYANYVVQKILETSTENQRDLLLSRIRVHLPSLKKYTYGKHIVARFEQLFGEEIHASGS